MKDRILTSSEVNAAISKYRFKITSKTKKVGNKMYVLKLDKDEDIKIYKELKKNKALISVYPYWDDNYDYFLFNKKINDQCIEIPDCYQEPYWFYQFDIPEGEWINLDSYDYNSDTGASGISNKRLTSEDMSDGVEILNEQYYDKKIDWHKIIELLK